MKVRPPAAQRASYLARRSLSPSSSAPRSGSSCTMPLRHLLARLAPDLRIVGAERCSLLRRQRRVAGGNAEIRGALKHRELAGLLGDHRHRLDRRRSGADHADAQAGEIDRLVRPVAGVVDLALEVGEALDVGHPRIRQAAGGEHDDICAVTVLPSEVVDRPAGGRSRRTPPGRPGYRAAISRPQIEAVGDVVGVFQDLRLRRVALAPVPFLLQFVRERIGILHALDVAARAGIAVPVPGAADIAALLIDPDRQSQPAQPVQHVHSGKTGADHDDIVDLRRRRTGFCRKWIARRTSVSRSLGSFSCCRTSILPVAAKRKRQNGLLRLDILPCGMRRARAVGSASARKTGSGKAAWLRLPLMR